MWSLLGVPFTLKHRQTLVWDCHNVVTLKGSTVADVVSSAAAEAAQPGGHGTGEATDRQGPGDGQAEGRAGEDSQRTPGQTGGGNTKHCLLKSRELHVRYTDGILQGSQHPFLYISKWLVESS